MPVLASVVLVFTTSWILAGLVALGRVIARSTDAERSSRKRAAQPPPLEPARPISVLKPLCGRDADLETNLESFFVQDHPSFELVFGVTSPDDPALEVVRRLSARYPNVHAEIVVHDGSGALNPKVDNLAGMLPYARHDLCLVSDSNVRAPRHYVRELADVYQRERAGLVTNLFVGGGENTLGSALESVELTGFTAPGVALPTLLGDPLLVGKSALFSRRALQALGGIRRFADVLAEDFVLGKTFAHAGERVVMAPTVLINVVRGLSLRAAFARRLRWAMLRFRLRPVAALLEPVTSPLAMLPFAWIALGPWWALVWTFGLMVLRDAGAWLILRGPKRIWLALAVGPLRDLLALLAWAIAPLKHHVSWRGKRYRLGAGTLLYPESGRA